MSLQLGQTAPDFSAESSAGDINLHDYSKGRWLVFFSHPKDFTPVCTTELGAFASRKHEFEQRNTLLLGLSVDSVEDHKAWAGDIADVGGTELNYPLLADPDLKVAKQYGMLHPETDATVTVRSVFIIDPEHKVRATLTYPPSAGRSVDEILRVLDSLQLTDGKQLTTPVEWQPGDDVILSPAVSDEEAAVRYPQGLRTVKPYLRYVEGSQA